MKNICFIAGTRPEIIKVAPVIKVFSTTGARKYKVMFCITGQHKTMAEQALNIFNLTADYNLNIMSANQTLNSISARIFELLPPIFEKVRPDLIFIQGDTITAAIAGLVGFYMKIPVAHIEAGLRTYNLEAPFPEELNRRLISNFSRFHFVPTTNAKNNLLKENCPPDNIIITGNTIVDSLNSIKQSCNFSEIYSTTFNYKYPFVLITAHRRESFGQGFDNICRAISDVAEKNKNVLFVYPVHLNPNVQKPVEKHLSQLKNVILLKPLPYIELLSLLANCLFCVTDSGGIQEEAPSFNKYTIVLRETTERIESIEKGLSELVGTSYSRIASSIEKRINISLSDIQRTPLSNPFGDGKASEIIYKTIDKFLS